MKPHESFQIFLAVVAVIAISKLIKMEYTMMSMVFY